MPLFISLTLLLWKIYCVLHFLSEKAKKFKVQLKQWNDPSHAKLLVLSAKQATTLIRSRQLTSQQLVKFHIDQMKTVNPYLNAAVCYRFEEAMNKAQEMDRILDGQNVPPKYTQENKPLLGVPFTVKESQGMPILVAFIKGKGQQQMLTLLSYIDLKKLVGFPLPVQILVNYVCGMNQATMYMGQLIIRTILAVWWEEALVEKGL